LKNASAGEPDPPEFFGGDKRGRVFQRSRVSSTLINFLLNFYYKGLKDNIMSIRMVAQELYRLLQEVEKIEKQFKNAPPEEHEEIKDRLRKIKAERNRIRSALEGRINRQSKHHIR